MKRWTVAGLVAILAASPTLACSICNFNLNSQTLRQHAGQAKLVLYGSLGNPRLNPNDPVGVNGTADLNIEKVIKNDPFLGIMKVVELPRYVPVDAKNPPKFFISCDVFKKDDKVRLDPYRGMPVE